MTRVPSLVAFAEHLPGGREAGVLPESVMDLISIVPDPGGCWAWTGATDSSGYGVLRIRIPGTRTPRPVRAHRFVFEVLVGPIPNKARDPITGIREDCELDHTCHNRACVNPAHLEPVSKSENLRRRRVK